jgi:hypothetical protein
MRRAELDARGLDRASGVSADTIRNLLRGKTRAMTDGNLRLVSEALDAALGTADTFHILRWRCR